MSVAVSTQTQDNKTVVMVAGEVDVSNAAQLREALGAALLQDTVALEVNLADVPYIDSTGIGVLVGVAHRAQDANKTLTVTNPQRNVARVLDMLGVTDDLGIVS